MKDCSLTYEVYSTEDVEGKDFMSKYNIKVENTPFTNQQESALNIIVSEAKVGEYEEKCKFSITKEEALELADFIKFIYS